MTEGDEDKDKKQKNYGRYILYGLAALGLIGVILFFLHRSGQNNQSRASALVERKAAEQPKSRVIPSPVPPLDTISFPLAPFFFPMKDVAPPTPSKKSNVEIVELPDEEEERPATKPNDILRRLREKHKDGPVPAKRGRKRLSNGDQAPTHVAPDPDVTDRLPYEDLMVVSNAGAGDCLFHCYARALHGLGKEVSVRHLREAVARATGERELAFLSEIYAMAQKENDIQLLSDYSFMQGVETVQDLRRAILRPSYFGDEMALAALEKTFPIHCIVLQLVEDQDRIRYAHRLSENEEFVDQPFFAILILDLWSQHYELCTYRGKPVMREEELPMCLQELLDYQRRERELKRREKEILYRQRPIAS